MEVLVGGTTKLVWSEMINLSPVFAMGASGIPIIAAGYCFGHAGNRRILAYQE